MQPGPHLPFLVQIVRQMLLKVFSIPAQFNQLLLAAFKNLMKTVARRPISSMRRAHFLSPA